MIVHLPVIACPFALVLLVLGRVLGEPLATRGAWVLLVLTAGAGAAAYYSGPAAWEQIAATSVDDKPWVEQHAVIARVAFLGLVIVGVLAIQAILQEAQGQAPPRALRVAIFALTLALCHVLAWTAHLGGQIRHVEIREPEWLVFPHFGLPEGLPEGLPDEPSPDPVAHPEG